MPAWSGIIQISESGEAGERPVVDGSDLVAVQVQGPESSKTSERPVVDDGDPVTAQGQVLESSKASERPVVDDGDIVVVQAPRCGCDKWQRRDSNEFGILAVAVVIGTTIITSSVDTTTKDVVQQHDGNSQGNEACPR